MTGFLLKVAAFLGIAAIAFVVTLHMIPRVIMGKLFSRMEAGGVPLHGFVLSPRMTPQTQTVVRASPDLAYSICRFDFAATDYEVQVEVAAYDRMASVSFFDMRTNNFAVRRVPEGQPVLIKLRAPGHYEFSEIADNGEPQLPADTIESPSERGVILIRRLAPSADDYERVEAISGGDSCAAVKLAGGFLAMPES